jgi:hypothetical protein
MQYNICVCFYIYWQITYQIKLYQQCIDFEDDSLLGYSAV